MVFRVTELRTNGGLARLITDAGERTGLHFPRFVLLSF